MRSRHGGEYGPGMAAKTISVGRRRFLVEWLIANAVALGAGWAVTGAIMRMRQQPYYGTVTSAARAVRLQTPSLGIALAVLGMFVGTAQWLCLHRLHVSVWWVPATCLSWALFGVAMGVLSGRFGSSVSGIGPAVPPTVGLLVGLPAGLIAGLLPGAFQAVVLRRHHVRWWPTVSLAGLVLGLLAASCWSGGAWSTSCTGSGRRTSGLPGRYS
jgi:hypothetical protein